MSRTDYRAHRRGQRDWMIAARDSAERTASRLAQRVHASGTPVRPNWALSEPRHTVRMGSTVVIFSAEQAAASLWDYGEDALIDDALALSDSDLRQVWSIAGNYWDPGYRLPIQGQRVVLGHVSALATITFLEGKLRPLARERRRPQKSRPEHLRDPRPVPPGVGLTE